MKMMAAAVGMAAALTASAMTEAISYRGQIKPVNGAFAAVEVMSMTFRIYDSAEPGAVLWARQVPVSVRADGSFYVELKDEVGTRPDGTPETPLARACASVKGNIEIGLTPPDSQEFPHQTLRAYARAERARYAAQTPFATLKKTLSAKDVTVGGDIHMPGGTLKLSKTAEKSFAGVLVNVDKHPGGAEIGGSGHKVVLHGGVTGWGDSNDRNRDRVGIRITQEEIQDEGVNFASQTPETVFRTAGETADPNVQVIQSF